jgi:transketolase
VLDRLWDHVPYLVGGSADLAGSGAPPLIAKAGIVGPGAQEGNDPFEGGNVHFGVREHAMAAITNGIALDGTFIAYCGTFLIFSDYMRPSIRLAALMKLRSVFVFTHDSIFVGEDGPTHQPVEHLAALRAIPNLLVFRPADAIETAECWELALKASKSPSVLALTRQGVPSLRREYKENLSAHGGYILAPAKQSRQVTLIASGSEVEIAMQAQKLLQEKNISAAVVSMPCWELFEQQAQHYRDEVLGPGTLHVAIEAGLPFGWERWIEPGGSFVGMRGFGASAPVADLYRTFNINAETVVETVVSQL